MNKDLENDFKALVSTAGGPEEKSALNAFFKKHGQDEAAINELLIKGVRDAGKKIEELSVRMQLENISEIISLSYLARHYFGKSRGWLTQRVNGAIVNGKKAVFTPEQINTLNAALQDVSKRIGSISVV